MIYHNKKFYLCRPRGFIALMSAVVISVVLLLLATTGSLIGFNSRFNILESEYKERSSALAEACVDQALLQLAHDASWEGDATSTLGSEQCYVGPVSPPAGGHITLKTRANFQNSYSHFEVVINAVDLSVVSWKEDPTF